MKKQMLSPAQINNQMQRWMQRCMTPLMTVWIAPATSATAEDLNGIPPIVDTRTGFLLSLQNGRRVWVTAGHNILGMNFGGHASFRSRGLVDGARYFLPSSGETLASVKIPYRPRFLASESDRYRVDYAAFGVVASVASELEEAGARFLPPESYLSSPRRVDRIMAIGWPREHRGMQVDRLEDGILVRYKGGYPRVEFDLVERRLLAGTAGENIHLPPLKIRSVVNVDINGNTVVTSDLNGFCGAPVFAFESDTDGFVPRLVGIFCGVCSERQDEAVVMPISRWLNFLSEPGMLPD